MKFEWKSLFKIGVVAFILYLCVYYWSAVSGFISMIFGAAFPLILGCVIAFIINLPMTFFEKHFFPKAKKKALICLRRPLCMTAAIITVLAIIALVIGLIVPQLVSCIKLIISEAPAAIDSVAKALTDRGILTEDIFQLIHDIDWQSKIGQIAEVLTSGIGNVMDVVVTTVASVFNGIVTTFLSVIFAIYLLAGKDTLGAQAKRLMAHYLPAKIEKKISYIAGVMNDCFRRYITGQCTEAVILGILCFIGMLILRLPYAAMVSALIAFTALIPVAGAYIGAGVGAFLILMESPMKALIFLIFIVILQQLEGNIIFPRVVGSSMGLPGIWVLAAVTVGGGILGVIGMLIGVPLAATLYRIIKNDINKQKIKS